MSVWFSASGSRLSAARVALVIALALVGPAEAFAQRPLQRPGAAQRQRPGPGGEVDSGSRARLESEVRRNFAALVRRGVGLSDEQMRQLVPITQRYEQQRRQIQVDERDARMTLRQTMRNEQTADPRQVELMLQKLVDVHKRRAQLLEGEQRELAAFMTPVQRAKYMALQDQIRRRLEQMRQRRAP
jgi:protein CpxP